MKRKWLLLPVIASMAFSGCSSADKDQPDENLSSTSAAAMETATAAATAESEETQSHAAVTQIPPSAEATAESEETQSHAAVAQIPPSAEATNDLSDVTCSADQDGSWTFKATVNNPGDTQRRYTVAVAVIVNAAVQGHAMIAVDVPANSTEPVVAKDFAIAVEPGAVCEPVMSVED